MIVNRTPQENTTEGWDYKVDDVADIATLPVMPVISGGSTAFVINTSTAYMLGTNGWREI